MSPAELFSKIKAKLDEPSTHAGVAIVLSQIYPFVPYPYSWALVAVAGMFGFGAIIKSEK